MKAITVGVFNSDPVFKLTVITPLRTHFFVYAPEDVGGFYF
ncbi:hypothetical protein ACFFIX_08415 [Metabacillus herbersteinensis]|uniref:Uncharacterized protein n=1 Tax=Metabacillus herbersteinensis TaxID=283816 RepID=A0ABV6GDK4_9BACI